MELFLLIAAIIGIISILVMVAYMVGLRRGLSRPDGLTKVIGDFSDALRAVGEALASGFDSLFSIFNARPYRRRASEHPLDWVKRVGAAQSGHCIRPGEEWRYKTLRDWWTPDDVVDQYGLLAPETKDLWSE